MIEAKLANTSRGFEDRLASLAAGIAASRLRTMLMSRRQDGSQWRDARLLWPLFSKDR